MTGAPISTRRAIVAAGFDYQPVRDVRETPDCFSRPICRLAMMLNDEASNADRQRLLAFVTRLACADTPEIEAQRQAYIASQMSPRVPMTRGIEILESALAIGRQADLLALDTAHGRMEAARERASTATSFVGTPVFAKVKSWLVAKKVAEVPNDVGGQAMIPSMFCGSPFRDMRRLRDEVDRLARGAVSRQGFPAINVCAHQDGIVQWGLASAGIY
jgi:hypothetical protein